MSDQELSDEQYEAEGWKPCSCCGIKNMDYNACPQIKTECNDCCGCEE